MNAEDYMKSKLDGFFFVMGQSYLGQLRVFVRKVGRDQLPHYHLLLDETERAQEAVKKRGPAPANFTPEHDEQIIELRSAGVSWEKIGLRMGKHKHSIRLRYEMLVHERGLTPVVLRQFKQGVGA
jgi:hypothetical protein